MPPLQPPQKRALDDVTDVPAESSDRKLRRMASHSMAFQERRRRMSGSGRFPTTIAGRDIPLGDIPLQTVERHSPLMPAPPQFEAFNTAAGAGFTPVGLHPRSAMFPWQTSPTIPQGAFAGRSRSASDAALSSIGDDETNDSLTHSGISESSLTLPHYVPDALAEDFHEIREGKLQMDRGPKEVSPLPSEATSSMLLDHAKRYDLDIPHPTRSSSVDSVERQIQNNNTMLKLTGNYRDLEPIPEREHLRNDIRGIYKMAYANYSDGSLQCVEANRWLKITDAAASGSEYESIASSSDTASSVGQDQTDEIVTHLSNQFVDTSLVTDAQKAMGQKPKNM